MVVWQPKRCLKVEVGACWTGFRLPPAPPEALFVVPYKDKSAQLEYQRKWIANRRAKYIAIHGGQCAKCGGDQDLEFDHIDPEKKVDHRIWSWSEERIQGELLKCQLLCSVCHKEKSIEEMAYPERRHGTNLMYLKERCRCDSCRAAHAEVNSAYR